MENLSVKLNTKYLEGFVSENDIDAIRINNSRKIVKDTHVLLSLLPSKFSESCVDLLKQIKEKYC